MGAGFHRLRQGVNVDLIKELRIVNIGGLDEASIKMGGNFVAITGESGAGKSSIVRSLELLSGKRAQSSLIKSGMSEASVEAVFSNDELPELDKDLQPEEGLLFLKRGVLHTGRGRAYVQGRIVPLSSLSEVSHKLLRIQSQFAQLDLLDPSRQLEIVDLCGGKELLMTRQNLEKLVLQALHLERKIRKIKEEQDSVLHKFRNAGSIVETVGRLGLTSDSEEQWNRMLNSIEEKLARQKKLQQCEIILTGGMSGKGAFEDIEAVCLDMCKMANISDREKWSRLSDALISNFQEMLSLLRGDISKSSLEEMRENVDKLEKKIGYLRKIKRDTKTRTTEELALYCAEADEKLSWLRESYSDLERMEQRVRQLRRNASQMAMDLRKKRTLASKTLETRVNQCLKELSMQNVTFSIAIHELKKLRSKGAEEVEFLLSWDNERWGAVSKMASGGELSRLLLSVQLSLPDSQLPATMVFDEVEAGLGGKAAVLTGYKLKELSHRCQVILITHEATIAALANQHFVVRKDADKTEILEVKAEERIAEIARMLSGDKDLREARVHAKKLLLEGHCYDISIGNCSK